MTFQQSIKTCLCEKYACFSGRASLSEFWWFELAMFCLNWCVSIVLSSITLITHTDVSYISPIVSLAFLLPSLGVAVRRLHDIGKSGWWLLLTLTIIGAFVLLYFYCKKSQVGENKYGAQPE